MTITKKTRELEPGDTIKHGRMTLTVNAVDRCLGDADYLILETTNPNTGRARELLVPRTKEWQLA